MAALTTINVTILTFADTVADVTAADVNFIF